ncbi:MAG TPA: DNA polymerase [Acidimicrobiales bacterium]|nr:DNA polymerase [Acidimicrobiales bacterium]
MRRPGHPLSPDATGAPAGGPPVALVAGGPAVVEELRRDGVDRGAPVALALDAAAGVGVATATRRLAVPAAAADPVAVVEGVERALRPRWVWWDAGTAARLVAAGVRVATCWDLAAVDRLLHGGWRVDPAQVWARAHGLPVDEAPSGPPDLWSVAADDEAGGPDGAGGPGGPVRRDGHLKATWVGGGWAAGPDRLAAWAAAALAVAERQRAQLDDLGRPAAAAVARSESTAELLCAELAADGLPVDRAEAERIVAGVVGPRARTEAEAAAQRARRDAEVLRHVPGAPVDLRSPGQVRSLLRRVGIEVADTRAWRLEALRDRHPVVEALLAWRKAERIATTYGYGWLDRHLGADGRLRGEWTASDGAAGRMTATAGLHNLPAELRGAVAAEPGHVFVRADLGQIEPRVLAAVSGDRALAAATATDDLYAPVARGLGVDRESAKVAMLGAMYGQTTGRGAQVLRRLEAAYPVAMAYLAAGDEAGRMGRDVRTHGGRLVRLGAGDECRLDEREARRRAAARGRYGRNALVQGAAAELFKMWAVTVRARVAPLGARIVLCLHDELLVHAPAERGDEVARVVAGCLDEAAGRWAPGTDVRFVVDVRVVRRWSEVRG